MHRSASLLIVPASVLPVSPEAFREYVEQHFAPRDILGQACLVAFLTLSLKRPDHGSSVKGVAPSHRTELARYTAGLDGRHLSDWIDQASREGVITRLGAAWDDGTLHFDED